MSRPIYASTCQACTCASAACSSTLPSLDDKQPWRKKPRHRMRGSSTLWMMATVVLAVLLIAVGVAWFLMDRSRYDTNQAAQGEPTQAHPLVAAASTTASMAMPGAVASQPASAPLEPPASSTAPQPPAASVSPQPPAVSATPQSPVASATPQPLIVSATPQPPAVSATPQPPASSATPQPLTVSATPQPPASSTSASEVAATASQAQEAKANNAKERARARARARARHHHAPIRLCPDRRFVSYDVCIAKACKLRGNIYAPQCVQYRERIHALHDDLGNHRSDQLSEPHRFGPPPRVPE